MGNNIDDEEDVTDVPSWVIKFVLSVRLVVVGVACLAAFYGLTELTSLSLLPPVGAVISMPVLRWFGIMVLVEFIVIGIAFYPAMIISWLSAAVVYKPLRDDLMADFREELENSD